LWKRASWPTVAIGAKRFHAAQTVLDLLIRTVLVDLHYFPASHAAVFDLHLLLPLAQVINPGPPPFDVFGPTPRVVLSEFDIVGLSGPVLLSHEQKPSQ
jgi:hypothetical protein